MSTEAEGQFEIDGVKLYTKTWIVRDTHLEPTS